jgi:hypothetical protein
MATPYQFTPRIPAPPHPTPLSVSAYKALPNSKAKRPPIHNPYDKFTQPEFDAWIGDITSALKRALGQIEVDDELKALERTQEVTTGDAATGYRPIDLEESEAESEDEALNDSFAEIKARRLLGKGKARDPREGPGLGGTDRTKPIEIVSSDEEEEHEVELAIGVENDENETDEEEEEEEEEEEGDYSEQEEDYYSWKQGQSSSQQLFSPAKRRRYIQEEESEGDVFEEDYEEDFIENEELENDVEAVIQPPTQHTFSPVSRLARRALPIPANAEFISIDDSDEETGLEDQEPITLGPPKVAEVEFQELQYEDVDEQLMEREQSVEVDEIVEEDTTYMHKPIPPLGSAPPNEADIITWPFRSSYQQDAMDYESLYANIEAATVQPEEQAGNL